MFSLRTVVPLTVLPLALLMGGLTSAHGQSNGGSLFADPIAREPGDVLTIVLNEQTSAERESSYEGDSESSVDGSGSGTVPGGISGSFSTNAEITTETENSNESAQSDMLNGTFTARVTGVDNTGNLQIRGERRLTIDGVTHIMEVSGLVRPTDVREDNTVLSTQIANARIKYGEDGFRHQGVFSKGLLLKGVGLIATGLSVFFGAR